MLRSGRRGRCCEERSERDWRLRLQPASLVIPERVAVAVEANGLLIVRQRVDLLHEKGVRHGLLAGGGALLPVAWTRKHSRGAVTRQATGQELRPMRTRMAFG